MTKTNLEIEEEFDEKFPNWTSEGIDGFRSCYLDGGHCGTSATEVKDRIQKEISILRKNGDDDTAQVLIYLQMSLDDIYKH